MTSDAHKAPRSHGDGREAVGTGIAYLSVSDAAQRVGTRRTRLRLAWLLRMRWTG